jgi:hypothetical protein
MKRIIKIFVFLIFITQLLSILTIASSGPELQAGVFGSSILTGLKRAGSFIYNNGDQDILDIVFTFSIKGGFDNSINVEIPNNRDILEPNTSYLLITNEINGFGPVVLSIYATSSNAGNIEETMKGFQLGSYTITQPYVISWY